jgi:hypothetical protein
MGWKFASTIWDSNRLFAPVNRVDCFLHGKLVPVKELINHCNFAVLGGKPFPAERVAFRRFVHPVNGVGRAFRERPRGKKW